jgi:DNA-3-methyladenine glycosylase I
MFNYKEVFTKLEASLMMQYGISKKEFDKEFSSFKDLTFSEKTDDWYFDDLKFIAFYSGFKAETVTNKTEIINKHFPNYKTVAKYGEKEIAKIMADKEMIKHPGKIQGVINNAKIFVELVKEYGSIHKYLVSLKPDENLETFYKEIRKKFSYLGEITAFHFMLEIGLNCVKPDRVLVRIFKRLGLIEKDKQFWLLIEHARKFAEATGHPIRYIDAIFVIYGQEGEHEICLENKPKCNLCQLQPYCEYYKSNNK